MTLIRTLYLQLPTSLRKHSMNYGCEKPIGQSALFSLLKLAFGPAVCSTWVGNVTGLENLPKIGPVIIASNHASYLDFLLLSAVSPRQVQFMAGEVFYNNLLIRKSFESMGYIQVDRNGILPWPVLIQALWWFAKYRLRLTEDADVAMNKVLSIFAGLPASKMEHLLNEFFTASILPCLRKEAMAEINRLRAAGKKVILVSSSIDFLVQLICEHVGADGWVATELGKVDGKLTGRISGRAVYGEEKFPALQRYADGVFGSWLLDAAYGDHGSDASLLERARNSIVVCPDHELKRIAGLNGWRVVIWS